jgi:hypothetical protein
MNTWISKDTNSQNMSEKFLCCTWWCPNSKIQVGNSCFIFGITFKVCTYLVFYSTQFHQFIGKHALADLTTTLSSFSLAYEQGFVRIHDLKCWNNIGNMLSTKVVCLFCLSHWDPANHGASCYAVRIVESPQWGALNWFFIMFQPY